MIILKFHLRRDSTINDICFTKEVVKNWRCEEVCLLDLIHLAVNRDEDCIGRTFYHASESKADLKNKLVDADIFISFEDDSIINRQQKEQFRKALDLIESKMKRKFYKIDYFKNVMYSWLINSVKFIRLAVSKI